MHVCHSCHRQFNKRQSLFGHLRHCKQYAEFKEKQKNHAFPTGQSDHRGTLKADSAQATGFSQSRDFMDSFFKTLRGEDSTVSQENSSAALEIRRRTLLQRIKVQVIETYFSSEGTVTTAMRGEALKAIEAEMNTEPLEKFSWQEIYQRAIAIRDKIYAPYFQREREEQAHQESRKREYLKEILHQQRKAAHTQARKTVWLELARPHIAAECVRRSLPSGAKISMEGSIEQRIDLSLTGEESEQEAEATIRFLIHQHFQGIDEKEAARWANKRHQVTHQLVDVAIELAPLGLTLATPYLAKGVNWMMDKLSHLSSPGPDVSSQENQEQQEKPDPTQHACDQEAPLTPPPDGSTLNQHSSEQPAVQERLDPPEGCPEA